MALSCRVASVSEKSRLSVDVISGERVWSQTRFEAYVFHQPQKTITQSGPEAYFSHHNRENDHQGQGVRLLRRQAWQLQARGGGTAPADAGVRGILAG